MAIVPDIRQTQKGHKFNGNQYVNYARKPTQSHEMNEADKRYFQRRYAGSIKDLYHRLITSARQNKREVLISLEDFGLWKNSQPFICHYCGQLLSPGGLSKTSATIDRQDNDKPYTLTNIVMACNSCNASKRQGLLPKNAH